MADTAIAESGKQAVQQSTKRVTDYSLGIFGTSDNFIMAMQMAKALASSTIVPQTFQKNEANCLIAIEQAQRLRVSPMMVMQNLHVIQGRPSWSSKFLIAAINNSGKFDMELQFEETQDKDGKPFSCTAWTTKNGRKVNGMTVDMDMAKEEGWLSKNGSKWKTMPQLMLRYRAASFFSSLNCPELTMGLYTREEMQDDDFKEYPIENMQEQVQQEIAENANSQVFEEPNEQNKEANKDALPPFMSA
jgi:exonuclease I|nr:MAG TPA: RecT protein [Bacteriophage sp.]